MSQITLTGGDTLWACQYEHWGYQTFRPSKGGVLQFIDLNLEIHMKDICPKLRLYRADASHKPMGSPIGWNTGCLDYAPGAHYPRRFRFFMNPVDLKKDEYYCFVLPRAPFVRPYTFWWQYDADDATYPRGVKGHSLDQGHTWVVDYDDDFLFAAVITPDVPPIPPPPPIKNFAILDVQYEVTSTGIIITATTNTPCHLYCYWTATEPEKHLIPMLTRGTNLHTQLKMCFVNWHENEQEEAGDTLIHTFIKEPWAHCETRWFTFRAMIMGEWVSPATEKMPPPEQWSHYHEPWGAHLNANNTWYPWLEPEVPEIMIAFGICTLTNPGYSDCGIYAVAPPPFPLVQTENLDPLLISFDNPEVDVNSTSSQIHIELIFRKGDEAMSIYLAIGLGAEFEHLKPWWTGELPTRYYGVFYVGTGEHTIDLYALFVLFRNDLGLSADPTNWQLSALALALGTESPACTDYLKNDYLTLYFTDPVIPWSPSVSPIFKKHRFYTPPPNEMEFRAVAETGHYNKYAENWYDAWSSPTGAGNEGERSYECRAVEPGVGEVTISRGILRFDTSELEDDIEIDSATLKIAFNRNVFGTYHSHICFVPAVGCGDEMAIEDYGALRENIDQVCDWIEIPPLDLETYYERDFYHVQLPIINKEGQTRIGIRASPDIFNFHPYLGNLAWVSFYGDFYDPLPNMDARLIVRWK